MTTITFENVSETVVLDAEAAGEMFNDLTLDVGKGERVTVTGEGDELKEKRTNGFVVMCETFGDVTGFGTKIEVALKDFFKKANYGSVDDFVIETDAEFFAPIAGGKAVKSKTIWDRDDAEALSELRQAYEDQVEEATNDEANAQSHWLETSRIVVTVIGALGSAKKAAEWAKGREGDNSAPSLIKTLGDSPNAVIEATYMARLNERQFEYLYAGINRGKAVELEVRKGMKPYMDAAGEAVYAAGVEYDTLTIKDDEQRKVLSLDRIMHAIGAALDAAGVVDDYADLKSAMSALYRVIENKVAIAETSGINKHSAGDGERAHMREIIGLEELGIKIAEVHEAVMDLREALDIPEKDGTRKKAVTGAIGALTGCAFYKKLVNAVVAAGNEASSRKAVANAEKAKEGAEAFTGAKKAGKELNAVEFAGRVWASILESGNDAQVEAVMAALGNMHKSHKAAVAAAAETSKAA